MPVEPEQDDADGPKGHECQQCAQQSEWNEIAHRLDIDREARHQLPGFGFVVERETQALQVIVDAVT